MYFSVASMNPGEHIHIHIHTGMAVLQIKHISLGWILAFLKGIFKWLRTCLCVTNVE